MDYDYKVNEKVLIAKDGILRKTESRYDNDPWTIVSVHTNGFNVEINHNELIFGE